MLVRRCTCTSTCMHVHLTSHMCPKTSHSCVQMCVIVSQSCVIWSFSLGRRCTCISTCIYVHLTPNVWPPFAQLHHNLCTPVWPYVHCPSHFWSNTLARNCSYINTSTHVHLTLQVFPTPSIVVWKCVHSLWSHVHAPATSQLVTQLCQKMSMDRYMYAYTPDSPGLPHPLCIVATETCTHVWPPVHVPATPHLVPHLGQKVLHASVHVCMSTSSPDLPHPLHLVEHNCVAECVFLQPLIWSHTLVKRCTCISARQMSYWTPYTLPQHFA